MSTDNNQNLTSDEKEFLELLIESKKKIREKDWKESLQTGTRIPKEGFAEKFNKHLDKETEDFTATIESLQEKNIIELKINNEQIYHTEWSIDYENNEKTTSLNKEGHKTGKKKKKYIIVPEKTIKQITGENNKE